MDSFNWRAGASVALVAIALMGATLSASARTYSPETGPSTNVVEHPRYRADFSILASNGQLTSVIAGGEVSANGTPLVVQHGYPATGDKTGMAIRFTTTPAPRQTAMLGITGAFRYITDSNGAISLSSQGGPGVRKTAEIDIGPVWNSRIGQPMNFEIAPGLQLQVTLHPDPGFAVANTTFAPQ